ncbi:MAG: hypothetical protein V1754_09105 [Pseudomonadota bacterium]
MKRPILIHLGANIEFVSQLSFGTDRVGAKIAQVHGERYLLICEDSLFGC